MSCAKDRDFRNLVQRVDRLVKDLDRLHANMERVLLKQFTTFEKQLAKLEKHAYGRLSETSVKAEQKRAERDLMAYVDQALKKFDKSRG